MINIYLYYYDDYQYIISNLNKLRFALQYSNDIYDKYDLKNIDNFSVKIIIYKKYKILAVQCNAEELFNEIKGLSLLKKVNLLDKNLFTKLFENNFSDNLCDLSINIDILGSEEELVEYEGHRLLEMNILEEFDFYDMNSKTKLKAYSLQPKGYKYILKVGSMNKLQFNKKYNKEEIEKILLKLVIIIKFSEWRNCY